MFMEVQMGFLDVALIPLTQYLHHIYIYLLYLFIFIGFVEVSGQPHPLELWLG